MNWTFLPGITFLKTHSSFSVTDNNGKITYSENLSEPEWDEQQEWDELHNTHQTLPSGQISFQPRPEENLQDVLRQKRQTYQKLMEEEAKGKMCFEQVQWARRWIFENHPGSPMRNVYQRYRPRESKEEYQKHQSEYDWIEDSLSSVLRFDLGMSAGQIEAYRAELKQIRQAKEYEQSMYRLQHPKPCSSATARPHRSPSKADGVWEMKHSQWWRSKISALSEIYCPQHWVLTDVDRYVCTNNMPKKSNQDCRQIAPAHAMTGQSCHVPDWQPPQTRPPSTMELLQEFRKQK